MCNVRDRMKIIREQECFFTFLILDLYFILFTLPLKYIELKWGCSQGKGSLSIKVKLRGGLALQKKLTIKFTCPLNPNDFYTVPYET